jgi:hypothetical protein
MAMIRQGNGFKSKQYRLSLQERSDVNRITKAVKLIEANAVTPMGEGKFHVLSDAQSIGYSVTPTACQCPDFILHQRPCKHMWAAIGGVVALLISDILNAKSLDELIQAHKPYSNELGALPEAFLAIARRYYAARRCELTSGLTAELTAPIKEGELAFLIKSQPKSNGRYNGIEI